MTSPAPLIIVTGLGRCGTSLLMHMLKAGGVPVTGNYPDFEVTPAARRYVSAQWLNACAGSAVKVLDPHKHAWPLATLMPEVIVLWLDRDPKEQAQSQAKFMEWTTGQQLNRRARKTIESSLPFETEQAIKCLERLKPIALKRIPFADLVTYPWSTINDLKHVLGASFPFDPTAAASVVISRPPECAPDMRIETEGLMHASKWLAHG